MSKQKNERFPIDENFERITPLCPVAQECSGCTFQDLKYDDEIKHKEFMILSSLRNTGELNDFIDKFEGVKGATNPYEYRNKIEFTFGDNGKERLLELGLRKRGYYYEVVPGSHCLLVDSDFREIIKTSLEYFTKTGDHFFHRHRDDGALINLVVRKGYHTGDILVNLVANENILGDLDIWSDNLRKLSLKGRIKGVLHTVDTSTSDAIRPDKIKAIWGEKFFTEKLHDLTFTISPFSFFQTNTLGAESLFHTVKEYANLQNEKPIIFDLYCGTGTIGQILAPKAKEVYGVDIVPEAIDAATMNAKKNNLTNCTFIAGDVKEVIDQLPKNPDFIVIDPPRSGIHPKFIDDLLAFNPKSFIYVSCNPWTMAIDLPHFFDNGYEVKRFSGHDLFPRTKHVETVMLLEKKS